MEAELLQGGAQTWHRIDHIHKQHYWRLLQRCFNNMFPVQAGNDTEEWLAERWYEPIVGVVQPTLHVHMYLNPTDPDWPIFFFKCSSKDQKCIIDVFIFKEFAKIHYRGPINIQHLEGSPSFLARARATRRATVPNATHADIETLHSVLNADADDRVHAYEDPENEVLIRNRIDDRVLAFASSDSDSPRPAGSSGIGGNFWLENGDENEHVVNDLVYNYTIKHTRTPVMSNMHSYDAFWTGVNALRDIVINFNGVTSPPLSNPEFSERETQQLRDIAPGLFLENFRIVGNGGAEADVLMNMTWSFSPFMGRYWNGSGLVMGSRDHSSSQTIICFNWDSPQEGERLRHYLDRDPLYIEVTYSGPFELQQIVVPDYESTFNEYQRGNEGFRAMMAIRNNYG